MTDPRFVYGICIGPSGRYDECLRPSLDAYDLGPRIERRDQPDIFDAYNSILDEAATRWPSAKGVVLLHDDVHVRDPGVEDTLDEVLSDPQVGLVGVVGGRGGSELSWWKGSECRGHVEHATHSDAFSSGVAEVDNVDGLFLALSMPAAKACRLRRGGYPAFHGYDSELSCQVRAHGYKVVVGDIDLFHDCKPGPWSAYEYGQAILEYALRWGEPSTFQHHWWATKRLALAGLAALQQNTSPLGRHVFLALDGLMHLGRRSPTELR
jgi:hypothetical protein